MSGSNNLELCSRACGGAPAREPSWRAPLCKTAAMQCLHLQRDMFSSGDTLVPISAMGGIAAVQPHRDAAYASRLARAATRQWRANRYGCLELRDQPVRRHAHATRCRTWPTGCSLPNVANGLILATRASRGRPLRGGGALRGDIALARAAPPGCRRLPTTLTFHRRVFSLPHVANGLILATCTSCADARASRGGPLRGGRSSLPRSPQGEQRRE